MHKTIIIFKGEKSGRAAFCEHVQRSVVPKLLEATPQSLKVTITVESPPALSVIPFSKTPIACVSLVGNDDFFNTVEDDPFLSSAHRVDEALPVSYEIDWKNGEVTPGVCLLTLFNQKVGLDFQVFLDRWHMGHTPLTLKIHPIWNYVRNVVTQTLEGPHYDGIVEEQVRERSDLLNPLVFFGGPAKCLWNMIVTLKDVRSFIDYSSIETYLAQEYRIAGL